MASSGLVKNGLGGSRREAGVLGDVPAEKLGKERATEAGFHRGPDGPCFFCFPCLRRVRIFDSSTLIPSHDHLLPDSARNDDLGLYE